jgi:hypothetical protein
MAAEDDEAPFAYHPPAQPEAYQPSWRERMNDAVYRYRGGPMGARPISPAQPLPPINPAYDPART